MRTSTAIAIAALSGVMFLAVNDTRAALSDKDAPLVNSYTVNRVDFGVFLNQDSRNQKLVPTNIVPLLPGVVYGWVIEIQTSMPKLRWRETYTLPDNPDIWDQGPLFGTTSSISRDGRTSIVESESPVTDGKLTHFWTVAPGDPAGQHVLHVEIEGKPVATFEFKVVPVEGKP